MKLQIFFSSGDFLVLNDTKVLPARLPGNRIGGASIELLFIEERGRKSLEGINKVKCKIENG